MKKVVILCFAVLLPAQAFADETFWEMLRKKIEHVTPQKKLVVTTAVGGVRGAAADADDLYWKGEEKKIDADEYESFKHAVFVAQEGNTSEAKAEFQKFITEYPQSTLKLDAMSALSNL